MNDRNKLFRLIQEYSFVLNETVLYLDTHPRCKSALRHYKLYKEKLNEAVRIYEEKYGMLNMYGGNSCDRWRWAEEPWPWEI